MIPLIMFVSIKSVYSKETIELKNDSFSSKKYGEVKLEDIKKLKLESYKGLKLRIYIKNGFVLGISPYSQFKTKADKEFMNFYIEFVKKYNNVANTK